MAFPTTSVLETFTGSDSTSPPNANWTNATGGTGALKILSNGCAAVSAPGSGHWNAATFGPDCEAYCTITTESPAGNNVLEVYARLVQVGGATVDGYCARINATANAIELLRMTNGARTSLTSASQTIANGDKMGIECIGTTIKAWYKSGAGAWTAALTTTDANHGAAGNIGLRMEAVWLIDDFGGGTVVTASTVIPTVNQAPLVPSGSQGYGDWPGRE